MGKRKEKKERRKKREKRVLTEGEKKLRRIVIFSAIILIILAVIMQRFIFNYIHKRVQENAIAIEEVETDEVEESTVSESVDIETVATMSDTISTNSVWCGTLQLVWNSMMDNLVDGEIVFKDEEESEMVSNLNKQEFIEDYLSEDDYFQIYGLQTVALKETIESALEDKFDETSDILDSFEWYETEEEATKDDEEIFFVYAILKKKFTFEYTFEDLDNDTFEDGEYSDVSYFGVEKSGSSKIKSQIDVLYYNDDEDFAISVETNEGENIILCNNPEGTTFNEIYENINTKAESFSGDSYLTNEDDFKMPNMKINIKKDYEELEEKIFLTPNSDKYDYGKLNKVVQTIQFEINKEGGSLKSETGVSSSLTVTSVEEPKEERHFYLDDSFVIFLIEDDKDVPYYAANVTDITLYQ